MVNEITRTKVEAQYLKKGDQIFALNGTATVTDDAWVSTSTPKGKVYVNVLWPNKEKAYTSTWNKRTIIAVLNR